MTQSTQCLSCKHYWSPNFCDAFEDGDLPDAIFTDEIVHDHPVPGDHGIQWEPRDPPLPADIA